MKKYASYISLKVCAFLICIIFTWTQIALSTPEDVYRLQISPEQGMITKRFKGTAPYTVIHIEDAHASTEAQKNIAAIIESILPLLSQSSSIDSSLKKTDLAAIHKPFIGIEGAIGSYSLKNLWSFPLRDEKQIIGRDAVENGTLIGTELAALCAPQDIDLFGLEENDLFLSHLNSFYTINSYKEKILREIQTYTESVLQLKKNMLNSELARFDESVMDYESGAIDLSTYLPILSEVLSRTHFDLFSFPTFLRYHEALAQGDRNSYETIDSTAFLSDIHTLNHHMRLSLAKNQEEKKIILLWQRLYLLHQLLSLTATKNNVLSYQQLAEEHSFPELLSELQSSAQKHLGRPLPMPSSLFLSAIEDARCFYAAAADRDTVMVSTLLNEMASRNQATGILVAGGYHSAGIEQKLKEKNISFITITPRITAAETNNAYSNRMSGKLLPFDHHIVTPSPQSYITAPLMGLVQCGLIDTEKYTALITHLRQLLKGQSFLTAKGHLKTQTVFNDTLHFLRDGQYTILADALEAIGQELFHGELLSEIEHNFTSNQAVPIIKNIYTQKMRKALGHLCTQQENVEIYLQKICTLFNQFIDNPSSFLDTIQGAFNPDMNYGNYHYPGEELVYSAAGKENPTVSVYALFSTWFHQFTQWIIICVVMIMLAACGGGGSSNSSSPDTSKTTTDDILEAYTQKIDSTLYKGTQKTIQKSIAGTPLIEMRNYIRYNRIPVCARDIVYPQYAADIAERVFKYNPQLLEKIVPYFKNSFSSSNEMHQEITSTEEMVSHFQIAYERMKDRVAAVLNRSRYVYAPPPHTLHYEHPELFPLDILSYQAALDIELKEQHYVWNNDDTFLIQRPCVSYNRIPMIISRYSGKNWTVLPFNPAYYTFTGLASHLSPSSWQTSDRPASETGYYSNLWIGHRIWEEQYLGWPIIVDVNANGSYTRVWGKDSVSKAGATYRSLLSIPDVNSVNDEEFPHSFRISVAVPTKNNTIFMKEVSHPDYEALVTETFHLDQGPATVVDVKTAGMIRKGSTVIPPIGFGASSMYWLPGAHDSDTVRIWDAQGTILTTHSLSNPSSAPVTHFLQTLKPGETLGLLQRNRDEETYTHKPGIPYSQRTNLFFTLQDAQILFPNGTSQSFEPKVKVYIFPTESEVNDNIVVWAEIPEDIRVLMNDETVFTFAYTLTATGAESLPSGEKPVLFSQTDTMTQSLMENRWSLENIRNENLTITTDTTGTLTFTGDLIGPWAGTAIDIQDIPVYNNAYRDNGLLRIDIWTDEEKSNDFKLAFKINDDPKRGFLLGAGTNFIRIPDQDAESLIIGMLDQYIPPHTFHMRMSWGSPFSYIPPIHGQEIETGGGRIPFLRTLLRHMNKEQLLEAVEQLMFVPFSWACAGLLGFGLTGLSGIIFGWTVFFLAHFIPFVTTSRPATEDIMLVTLFNTTITSILYSIILLFGSFSYGILLSAISALLMITIPGHYRINDFLDRQKELTPTVSGVPKKTQEPSKKTAPYVPLTDDQLRERFATYKRMLLPASIKRLLIPKEESYYSIKKVLIVSDTFTDDDIRFMKHVGLFCNTDVYRLSKMNQEQIPNNVSLFYLGADTSLPPEIKDHPQFKAWTHLAFAPTALYRSFYVYCLFDEILNALFIAGYEPQQVSKYVSIEEKEVRFADMLSKAITEKMLTEDKIRQFVTAIKQKTLIKTAA